MSVLSGRVLLTGATGGIGQAIARALAARGAKLVITGRRSEVLDPLASELGAQTVACDLTNRDEVDRLVAAAGDVDVLVANAGLPASGALTELTQEQIDRMLETNLRAPIALARSLAPGMIDRGRGHMVFISSLSGKAASASAAIYCATKFGLRGFALGIRQDLKPHGVGVSVVLPGFISDAGMFADADVELPRGLGTRSPQQVAQAVIGAIERDRAQVEVAPLGVRLAASFISAAPELATSLGRKTGTAKLGAEIAAGQIDKR